MNDKDNDYEERCMAFAFGIPILVGLGWIVALLRFAIVHSP